MVSTLIFVVFSVDTLKALIAQQTEQLQTLNDQYQELTSQISSYEQQQIEADKQR